MYWHSDIESRWRFRVYVYFRLHVRYRPLCEYPVIIPWQVGGGWQAVALCLHCSHVWIGYLLQVICWSKGYRHRCGSRWGSERAGSVTCYRLSADQRGTATGVDPGGVASELDRLPVTGNLPIKGVPPQVWIQVGQRAGYRPHIKVLHWAHLAQNSQYKIIPGQI